MRPLAPFALAVVLLAALSGAAKADPILINFDDRPAGTYPATAYAASGVEIRRVNIPDAVGVGSVFTPALVSNSFVLFVGPPAATPSLPNTLFDSNTLRDYLLTFTSPVTSVSITTDTFSPDPEADILRLLALEPTGNPGEFRVVGLDQVAEVSPGGVVLTVAPGVPFSFALIQITTEPEGFDNLTFTRLADRAAIPEPATFLLCLSALGLGLVATRGGRPRRAAMP